MSVTQVRMSVGQWNIRLRGNIPRAILDGLTPFGHVAIIPGSVNVAEYGDNLLDAARYVGVFRSRASGIDGVTLSGPGLEMWLGDENGNGDVFESAVEFDADTFAAVIAGSLPPGGAITSGTIHSVPGTYTGTVQWVTPRKQLDYVTSIFGAEWRINNDGTLDAGTVDQLYVTDPRAILVAKADTDDLRYKALSGTTTMTRDNTNYTTRVVVLGEGDAESLVTGSADAPVVTAKDIHGNEVVITRVVSETDTNAENVDARAELILSQYAVESPNVSLNTDRYDIKGEVQVGDYIWVYDPDRGFVDLANEIIWRGEPINPVKLRVVELSWPVRSGWTVAFRDINGGWMDLSPHVFYEGGSTNVVVGDLPRSLTSTGGIDNPATDRGGAPDTTIPDHPEFLTWSFGAYQSSETNSTLSAVQVTWTLPLNTDASTILDGDHYEIRWRVNAFIGYRVLWGQLNAAPYKWGELLGNKWGAPITDPIENAAEWQVMYVPWGINVVTIPQLTPGVEYEFQIRSVDQGGNQGPWSDSSLQTTIGDLFAPSTPAAPSNVAGTTDDGVAPLTIQVTHTLGKSSGGTFNLEADLDHLEVHVGGSAEFGVNEGTLVGKMFATAGMILAGIPAVATFPIQQGGTEVHVKVVAVDRTGNKSGASSSTTVTAELISNAYISDLSVSKVTAGTITAAWILAGSIKTAEAGARVEITSEGIKAYDVYGVQTVDIDSNTGDVAILGELTAGDPEGARVEIKQSGAVFDDSPAITLLVDPQTGEVEYKAVLEHVSASGFGTFTRLARWPVDPDLQDDYSAGLLMQDDATLLFNTTNGGESQLGLGYVNAGRVYIRGYWKDNNYVTNEDAVWTAAIHTGAGFSSWGHTYGPTMDSTMAPNITLHSAALVTSWNITASSTTGFTVTWSGTADKWLYVWSARMG